MIVEFNSLHETVVADIFDTIKDGIKLAKDAVHPTSSKLLSSNSLSRATSGLTLVFPVICSDGLPIEVATMISKAIERKNVAMLQMAFSAYNITNSTDALEYLSQFHKNMNIGKMDLDQFMDFMESLDESATLPLIPQTCINTVYEDCKRNINYVFEEDINPVSLSQYTVVNNHGVNSVIITEKKHGGKGNGGNKNNPQPSPQTNTTPKEDDAPTAREKFEYQKKKDEEDNTQRTIDRIAQQSQWDKANKLSADKNDIERRKVDVSIDKNRQAGSDARRQALSAQLVPSDVKKANEMQPSLMIINFYVSDADKDLGIAQQAICGVKSKLYPVSSNDIMTKLITKNTDNNTLLKLIKVSTREISFVKDFLLGIDDAKLDSLSKSRRGSASRLFKALERRAIKGKIRKSLRLENSAKAISTLVISSEEAEQMKKFDDVDVMNPRVIAPIMEKLNLLYFVVVDTTSEAVYIITDGELEYDTYTFNGLERETSDSSYKKIVNLMTKISN